MAMRVDPSKEIEFGMCCTRLGEVFDLDPKTVKGLLTDVEPDGDRNGVPFWRIASAAPSLVTPEGDIESYIRRLKPGDLPAKFQKEFWTAMNLRTKYYQTRGDLWSTSRVYEVISTLLQVVRSTSRLFVDELESNTTISTRIRDEIQKEMDRMMSIMQSRVKEAFQNYDPSKDHVESLEVADGNSSAEDQSGADTGSEEADADAWLDSL